MSEKGERVCHIVAGPNGAGKSTFALRYLPDYAGAIEYVNPDLMAQGLSPTNIRLSALKAGKLALTRIADLIRGGSAFGFETTLSGRGHLKLLANAKASGYSINLYYLWMPSVVALPSRIRHRVVSGGHDVPTEDVTRRFTRSVANVHKYVELVDVFRVFDASDVNFRLIASRNGSEVVFAPELISNVKKDLSL